MQMQPNPDEAQTSDPKTSNKRNTFWTIRIGAGMVLRYPGNISGLHGLQPHFNTLKSCEFTCFEINQYDEKKTNRRRSERETSRLDQARASGLWAWNATSRAYSV
jgi:hypothetical protein